MECARLLEEAGERVGSEGVQEGEGTRIYQDISQEFNPGLGRLNGAANVGVSLDSVYVRGTEISGTPVTDGYHFGQTITNDYGRPYSSGFNNISGFTAHAVAGPFSFNLQGEYQHSPAVSPYSLATQQAIAAADFTPLFPGGMAEVNRFRLLDATIAFTTKNLQLSF